MKQETEDAGDQPNQLPAKRPEDILRLSGTDIAALPMKARCELLDACIQCINEYESANAGDQADAMRAKLDEICVYTPVVGGADDLRRQDWENNHNAILRHVSAHVSQYGTFPTINAIAENTQLSRQTIYGHLKAGISTKFYQDRLKTWEYMTEGILTNLYRESLDGNVAASKVLLDNIYRLGQAGSPGRIREQNNFVQVTGMTIIDDAVLSSLPDEAREKITDIVKRYT